MAWHGIVLAAVGWTRPLVPVGFRPDSLIFDLDGTLWDVLPTVALARNRVLDRLGIPGRRFVAEDIAPTVGLPVDEAYRRGFPDMAEDLRMQVQAAVNAELKALLPIHGARLYDGVREGLERLRAEFPLFIVSNCNTGYIESFLKWAGFEFFRDIECYGNTKEPKAENIKRVVARNALRAPVYIGDTASDHTSAMAAQVPYLHVTWGFGKPAGACPEFSRFDDLVTALIGLAR